MNFIIYIMMSLLQNSVVFVLLLDCWSITSAKPEYVIGEAPGEYLPEPDIHTNLYGNCRDYHEKMEDTFKHVPKVGFYVSFHELPKLMQLMTSVLQNALSYKTIGELKPIFREMVEESFDPAITI